VANCCNILTNSLTVCQESILSTFIWIAFFHFQVFVLVDHHEGQTGSSCCPTCQGLPTLCPLLHAEVGKKSGNRTESSVFKWLCYKPKTAT